LKKYSSLNDPCGPPSALTGSRCRCRQHVVVDAPLVPLGHRLRRWQGHCQGESLRSCDEIRVDPERCQGHSRCFAVAPDLFDIDDYGTSTARNGGDVAADRQDAVRLAVANCPEQAIEVLAD
jgi:ferredoxin